MSSSSDLASLKTAEILCREILLNVSVLENTGHESEVKAENRNEIHRSTFWTLLRNNACCMMVIRWCQVLGNDSEENHWKKLPYIDIQSTRKIFTAIAKKNHTEWSFFHTRAIETRNFYIAHTVSAAPNVFRDTEIFKQTASVVRENILEIYRKHENMQEYDAEYLKQVVNLPNSEIEFQVADMYKQAKIGHEEEVMA